MSVTVSWIAAIILAGLMGASTGSHPLELHVHDNDGSLEMNLVGESALPWSGSYELEVTGGPKGASNHSVQRGTATIRPGATTTVSTVRLGNPEGAQWAARLHVTPSSGEAYELEWRSKD
jgi:hypothetical protein